MCAWISGLGLFSDGSVAYASVTVPTSIYGDPRGEFIGPLALSEVASAKAPVESWARFGLRAGQDSHGVPGWAPGDPFRSSDQAGFVKRPKAGCSARRAEMIFEWRWHKAASTHWQATSRPVAVPGEPR